MQFACAHERKYFSTHKKHEDTEETNETKSVSKVNGRCSTIKCGCEARM